MAAQSGLRPIFHGFDRIGFDPPSGVQAVTDFDQRFRVPGLGPVEENRPFRMIV